MSNDSNGTSSAASCAKGHVFIYAGNNYEMPEGWPCACGMTTYSKSTTNDAYKFCAGCNQPLPTHMGPRGETTSGILIINKNDIRFERTPGAIITHNDGPKLSVFCVKCASEKASATTNDPHAAYEKLWKGEPKNRLLSAQQMLHETMSAMDVSDFYENLIASGELIVRSELVEWLTDQLRQAKEDRILRTSGLNAESAVVIQLKFILDYINKKP